MKLAKRISKIARWQNSFFFLLLFLESFSSSSSEESLFHFEKKQYASSSVETVAGQSAQLPCNMTVAQNDTVYLVLWFKEGLTTPIYSYDVRELLSGEPKHWWDSDLLGSRAYFNAHSNPAHLLLRHVNTDDAGQYKCRVDFQKEPTRNSRVNLTVVVPPRDVVIRDSNGVEIRSFIKPRSEGDRLHLSCIAYGGIPPPKLVWLMNGKVYDDVVDTSSNNELRNDLVIEKLTRNHLRAQLGCRATYGKAYPEFLSTATLDMNLEPLDVRILPPSGPFSAGRTYEIICSSSGSRPPAILTWWKDSKRIPTVTDQTSPDGNVSRSVIKLHINASHNGQVFICKAKNQNIPSAVIEDTLKIKVYYLPLVKVRLGASLNPSKIKEEDDVYFECTVEANPSVYKVVWKHNGKLVSHNQQSGVLLSNRSLVLQDVSREHSGNYVCVASNVEGDGVSRPFNLKIQYAPVCKDNQNLIYGVSKLENAHVTCQVEAVPQVKKFRWWFNNTAETLEVPEGRFTVGLGGRSVVTYTPTSDLDYGTLLCAAQNAVGEQETPCVFHIVPATRPEAPTNCTVMNISANSLGVACAEGFDGGLNQSFVMEVYTTNPHTLHNNLTSIKPSFDVSGLESDSEIQLIIYSGNSKGRSGITRLVSYTLKPPVKQLETRLGTDQLQLDEGYYFGMPSVLGSMVGGMLVLLVILIVALVSIRRKCWKRRCDTDESANHSSECSQTQFSIESNYHHNEFPTTKFLSNTQMKCQHPSSMQQQHAMYQHPTSNHCLQQLQNQQNYPITHNLQDLPPPPCQYATDPVHTGVMRSHQHFTPSRNESLADDIVGGRNKTDSSCMYDRVPNNSQECPFSWPKDSVSMGIGVQSSQAISMEESRQPLVYPVEDSSRRHSCASVTALTTISEDRESPGSPASRRESAL